MSKSTPSFVQPFLYALNRMQENESLRPTQYTERARALLVDRLGASGPLPEAAFSNGSVGLLADHTHYFDGFAMMLQLRQGIAVAVRHTTEATTRIVFDGAGTWTGDLPNRLAIAVFGDANVDMAVVSALPPGLGVARQASLTVAMLRVRDIMDGRARGDMELADEARTILANALGVHVSRVFTTGATLTDEGPFVLADASNGKYMPLEVASNQRPGFALVTLGEPGKTDAQGMQERRELVQKATAELEKVAFPKLGSLRNLEHRDLDKALDAVSRKYRPVVRHVVSANRNVQKLAVAIRKSDWQFFGALLKISLASIMQDWSTGRTEFGPALAEAERLSLEGIYGVVQTGELGVLLVVGQPFSIPAYIDALREAHTNGDVEAFIV